MMRTRPIVLILLFLALPGISAGQLTPPAGAALEGTVTDVKGAPVAGASVILTQWLVTDQGLEIPDLSPVKTATDREGRFVLGGLEPGRHVLDVSAPGYTQHYDTGVEIPARPLKIKLRPGTFVEGRVLDAGGAPVRGAGIRVRNDLQGEHPFYGLAETDQEGRYRAESLEPGLARVEARHAAGPWRPFQGLRLQPGRNRLDLTLPKANEISGRAVDDEGEPVAGARLWLGLQDPEAPIRALEGLTSADGRFVFPSVAEGSYRLLGIRSGLAQAQLPVRVAGMPIPDLELRFDRGAVIRGRIQGLTASDWQGLSVTAYSKETGYPAEGVVQTDGTYRIPNVSSGPWAVVVSHPLRPDVEALVQVGPGQKEVVQDLRLRD